MKFKKAAISHYVDSPTKRVLDIFLSTLFLISLSPIYIFIFFLIFTISGRPIIFLQKRIGKKGVKFQLLKFRTMQLNASKKQFLYKNLNEADGPVFKIFNDPRFTKIGKILSRTGVDELPQLINVLKGEMSLVGPRPLPVNEARKLTKSQKIRELVKPGIVSTWVTNGSHKLKFIEWMKLDKEYVENATLWVDLKVIKDSFFLILGSIGRWILNSCKESFELLN